MGLRHMQQGVDTLGAFQFRQDSLPLLQGLAELPALEGLISEIEIRLSSNGWAACQQQRR